jgi:hypothetical protein
MMFFHRLLLCLLACIMVVGAVGCGDSKMRRRIAAMDTETLERISNDYPADSKAGRLITEELSRRPRKPAESKRKTEPATPPAEPEPEPVAKPSPPSKPELDVPGLYGKRQSELIEVFPGLPPTDAGSSAKIEDWNGWKAVYVSFNGAGRLASISFTPESPLPESEAKRMVQEQFKVSLPRSYEKRAPALVAYRDMRGTIKTVNFSFVDWRTRDHRISEIGIFFNIGWNE